MQFWKMNGAGNDFIILNNLEERLPPSAFPLLARTLCTPHRSLGRCSRQASTTASSTVAPIPVTALSSITAAWASSS